MYKGNQKEKWAKRKENEGVEKSTIELARLCLDVELGKVIDNHPAVHNTAAVGSIGPTGH